MAEKTVFGLDRDIQTPEEDPFADAPIIEESVPEFVEREDTDASDPLAADAPTEEAPKPEEAEETPEPALDEAPAEEPPAKDDAPTMEEVTEEMAAGTPYTGRYKDKYSTIEAMEEAHRNALDLSQRQAERAKLSEQQNRELTEYLRVAGEYIEQQQKQGQAPAAAAAPANGQMQITPEIEQQAAAMGTDPETFMVAQQIARQQAEAQVAPLQQQLAAQEQQRLMAEHQQRANLQITNFRTAHADLDNDTEAAMVQVFEEFGLDPTVNDNYEIALEAASSPDLRDVFRANPTYIDTDAGLALARRLAGVHTVVSTSQQSTDELAAARKRATVESGNSGAAPQAAQDKPRDAWDEVLSVARDDRKKSVFGV
jgi:hypothetical protein